LRVIAAQRKTCISRFGVKLTLSRWPLLARITLAAMTGGCDGGFDGGLFPDACFAGAEAFAEAVDKACALRHDRAGGVAARNVVAAEGQQEHAFRVEPGVRFARTGQVVDARAVGGVSGGGGGAVHLADRVDEVRVAVVVFDRALGLGDGVTWLRKVLSRPTPPIQWSAGE
jgi:hypothetical protein